MQHVGDELKESKKEERGISPVIATILLIAATVAAAGIIAIFVSGLYVSRTAVVAGEIDGNVFDSDASSGEDFINENVTIQFRPTVGYLRYVGDSTQGLTVTVSGPGGKWGPFTASVRGKTDYSLNYVDNWGTWSVPQAGANAGIRWHLYVPVTQAGRLEEGATGFLNLYSDTNITSDTDNSSVANSTYVLWNYYSDLPITVSSGGDSFTTSFGTVRLFGFNYIA